MHALQSRLLPFPSTATVSHKQPFDTLLSFGDSYSATEVWGIPWTYCDGPPWIQRLANATGARLVNYAFPGATVDRRVATIANSHKFDMIVPDFLTQVTNFKKDHALDWSIVPEKTQVSIWFGANDTNGTALRANPHEYHERIAKSFIQATDSLHEWGARRFLFTNLADGWRGHYGIDQGPARQEKLRRIFNDFNKVLASHIDSWCAAHKDTICSKHDVRPAFNDMFYHPRKYGFIDGTSYCPAYANLTGSTEDYRQTSPCHPLPEYMWLNPTHLTWKAHIPLFESALRALGLS